MRIINRFRWNAVALLRPATAHFSQYRYPYNINREENVNYLKKVEKANKELTENSQKSLIPRRKRRIYDRPKHDLSTVNYTAWRLYDPQEMLCKFWAHGSPVVAKLQLQPKWVIHAFGMGLLPYNHEKSASLQFSFQDCNFSKFLLYEYRNTTSFAPNIPNYNYEDQSHLLPQKRKRFRLTPQEFWKSEEYFEFRLNCSAYAQKFKFKQWVLQTVEASKSKPSYDEFIDKKFGPQVTFNKKTDRQFFEPAKPAILCLTPQHFNLPKKGEKLKDPKVELPKRLGEQYRILEKKTEASKQEQKASAESKA